jgi:hypothetical protein
MMIRIRPFTIPDLAVLIISPSLDRRAEAFAPDRPQ